MKSLTNFNLLAEGAASSGGVGVPLLRLGFRPFYLGSALFAALAIPVWVAAFLGVLSFQPNMPTLLWHVHEMLFGFAVAVIIGFLLTAVKAWTGLSTPRGPLLGLLVGVWLAARLAAVFAPYPVYAALDIALLPLTALALMRVLLASRNYRNLPLVLILVLMAMANVSFHLAMMGYVSIPILKPLHATLALIIMVECVIAGRVIPAFMISANPGLRLSSHPSLERLTLIMTALGMALWVFSSGGWHTLVVLLLAAGLHVQRQWRWRPSLALQRPILWILQAAYAWIPAGLGLLGLAQSGLVSNSSGVHALAVGATGGLIIGMITRTARGHTGRPLKVSGAEVVAYILVMLAAGLRVFLPMLAAGWLGVSIVSAAIAWTAAFAIYLAIYVPWLTRVRLDGKDG